MNLGQPKSYESYGNIPEPMTPTPQHQTDIVSMPAQDSQNQEIIRWQLDTQEHLADIQMRLEGKEKFWNNQIQDFEYRAIRHPFLNDKGVGRIMGIIRTIVDPNTILADYSVDEAYTTIIDCVSACLDTLYMKRKDYEANKADLPLIRAIIENGIRSTLFRSRGGATMEYLRGSHRTITSTVTQPASQGGIINRMRNAFRL